VPPRSYDTTRRRAAAEGTRLRILEAARALIGGRGDLADFSMELVARKAGVARMTVYHQFRSRAGLLEALADHLAQRGGMQRMREVFTEPEFDRALRTLVETFVGFWASDRVTLRRLRALGVVFPDEASGPRDRDAWRREAIRTLLARHGRGGRSGRGPPRADVIDALATLTSFETFDAMAIDGRGAKEVAGLLADLARAAVDRAR
jgi:AcrR family transcriptional regulator